MAAFHAAAAAAQATIAAITTSREVGRPAAGAPGSRPPGASRGGPAPASPGAGAPPAASRGGAPALQKAPRGGAPASPGAPRGGAPAPPGADPGQGAPPSPGASRGGGPATAPPAVPPRPGAPASQGEVAGASRGATFRPGPAFPSAPRAGGGPVTPSPPGAPAPQAAPGALFRPGAPVPPSAPRTDGPGEGAAAPSRTASDGSSPRAEAAAPPLRGNRPQEKQEEPDEVVVLLADDEEPENEAENDAGTPDADGAEDGAEDGGDAGARVLAGDGGQRDAEPAEIDEQAPQEGESGAEAQGDGEADGNDGDEKAGGKEDAGSPGGRVRETPLPEAVSKALSSALTAVRAGVTDLGFGLDIPGAEEARRVQSEILAQLDDYVIPRVHTSTAPALVVVAGSTGAGKSTLLNTLANAKVSATGVRRPTTGTPVLACHPDDHEWFAEGDLLGSLRRLSEPDPGAASGGLVLVSTERLPPGVALLDTPDIDSVVEEHHEIAHRMLDAADLWIFVTTAARYADAPAWRLLRLAKERGAKLAIVLSRVPAKSREVITKHFVRMLTEYGLGEVDRFVVNEGKVTDGMLPDHEVSELRLWLTELSVDERRREQAVRATLDGVLNSFRTRVPALAKQLEIQVAFRRDLRADVESAYAQALVEVDESTGDGSLLRGEVLARWQDFAGSGDLMRTLQLRKPGRLAGKASHQAPERLSALRSALRTGLESVVVSAAQRAAEEAASRWLNRPGAQEILAAAELGQASDDLPRRAGRTIAAWQEHITELIRTEGVTKRSVARVISFDVESLSLILTIGLLGYGASEARNGTGALPQRLVHALLGAESLRNIGVKARSDLRARIGMLFDDETARYIQALDGAGIPDESAATRLYQATYNLEVAR
ncbi:GTPase [Streptosporangium sp. NPDC049248]|uniref:GTPase n=1 Tax=Streptosporangium sp. NPDC049248 TaxID=3155651 RepID=UPI003413A330